jgi:hypothetical protein
VAKKAKKAKKAKCRAKVVSINNGKAQALRAFWLGWLFKRFLLLRVMAWEVWFYFWDPI